MIDHLTAETYSERISDLDHLRECSQESPPEYNSAIAQGIRIVAILFGITLSFFAGRMFDLQMAFISITLISIVTIAITCAAEKLSMIVPRRKR